MAASQGIYFAGTRGKRISASTRGQDLKDLQKRFTRLTPRLLATIPETVLPSRIRDRITLPKGRNTLVSEDVLIEGLSALNSRSFAHEGSVGKDFFGRITYLSEVISVMEQALDTKQDGILLESSEGKITYHVNEQVAQSRGIEARLTATPRDIVKKFPSYENKLGLLIRINRYYGSLGDWIIVYVPLDITITDYTSH